MDAVFVAVGPADGSPSGREAVGVLAPPSCKLDLRKSKRRAQRKSLRRAPPPADAGLPSRPHRSSRPGVLPRAAFPPPPEPPAAARSAGPSALPSAAAASVSASPGAALLRRTIMGRFPCPPAAAARSTTRRPRSSTARAAAGPRAPPAQGRDSGPRAAADDARHAAHL